MARASAFSVEVNVSEVIGLADKLAGMTPAHIGALMVDAINETADSAYEMSRKAILGGINLTDDYVQRHMKVEHATSHNPEASIIAFGGKGQTTSLSHYGAMQESKPVTWSNERIAASHKFSTRWPGWVRRIGDASRGIEVGQKTDGVSVEVTRGSQKKLKTSKAIILPGKRDSEGNAMVFKRIAGSGRGHSKLKALQGPSVYQLFRVAGAEIEDQVYDNLERAVIDSAERQFAKELS